MSALVAGGVPDGTIKASIAAAPRRGALAVFGHNPAYDAASYGSQELSGFHPAQRSADSDVLPARDKVVARSRHLDRNNGWAAGGFERRGDAVVGPNIRLRCNPNFRVMGQTEEWADDWARTTEALFRDWGNDPRFLCDVERHLQFGGMVRLAHHHYSLDGEAAAAIYMIADRGAMLDTAVLVVDPDRLANPQGKPDDEQLRGGVELDRYGAAVAYHVRKSHPNDLGFRWSSQETTRIPREGPTGRPLFVHAINKRRAHQHRSVGRLASVMGSMRMLDRYDATELQAAIANAVFGLYVTSNSGSDSVREAMAPIGDGGTDTATETSDAYMAQRIAYHEAADLRLDGVRIAHLWDKEKIETIATERSGSNFEAFEATVLRRIASAFGLSYEQLSNDWSGINYSSARTLLNEIWRGLLADRHLFTQAFCTPIFAAWLEEAVARDMIEVPGGKAMFYRFRAALTQCQWIGPGRGFIDPKKEAEAAAIRIDLGLSSQTDECEEQGRDADQVRWQRKRDLEEDRRYGLVAQDTAAAEPAGGGGASGEADDDDPDEADRREAREAQGDVA